MADIRTFFGKHKARVIDPAKDEDDEDEDVIVRSRKRKSQALPPTTQDSPPKKRARTPIQNGGSTKGAELQHSAKEPPKKTHTPAKKKKSDTTPVVVLDSPSRDSPRKKTRALAREAEAPEPVKVKSPAKAAPKRKSRGHVDKTDADDDDDFEIKSPAKPPPKKKARTPSKKVDVPESNEIREIFDHIPTVDLPEPGPESAEPRKFNHQAHAQYTAPPAGAGTKEIPIGQENCLAGLSFVFTGQLDALGREEGQELVKRYGGRVTGAPTSKTSYVVLGNEPGPKKIEAIRKLNIKTINEDGLFELIKRLPANGGDSQAAAKHEEKKQKEDQKVKEMAAEMERQEKRLGNAGSVGRGTTSKTTASVTTSAGAQPVAENRLWTVKYAPTAVNQICGNKGQVEKLQRWLREWPKSQRIQFKKAGPDGSFCYRAVLIHGPPGIGKTTAAHLAAKLEGYDIVESNASDTRSKKLVETGLKGVLDNTSLRGYFAADEKSIDAQKKKLVLIMDEVDGMSAGDRGGVGALAQACKKTNIPIILICNERRIPKMKPFDFVTYDLTFRRPTVNEIRSRIASICFREGLKLPTPVIDALIEGTHADIRQIVNMISTAKLDQEAMSFDQSKSMSKAWEKHVILKPWDIAHKILGAGMFGPSSNKSLNEKIELYFNDHEFSYLMIQENYLKTIPSVANRHSGKERTLKTLELVDQAAESISDGDLVDRMIHGPQQHWSLMPAHAVFSFVRPASHVYGNLGGQASFTSWLGNNSKQGKLSRFVKEIQGHMRLRASGDRHEIRQQYLPTLWNKMVKKLEVEGKECVEDVIDLMDSYFLTKEDYDAIVELGLGPMDMEKVNIESQTKATFTRLYNQRSHPLPFMKASNVVAPKRASREKPDLEEAIEESDDAEDVLVDKDVKEGEGNDEDDDVDISKDKYVKQPKKKRTAPAKKAAPKKSAGNETAGQKKKASAKRKSKASEDEEDDEDDENDDDDDDDGRNGVILDDEDDDEDEDIKPTKGRGRGAGRGRGRVTASATRGGGGGGGRGQGPAGRGQAAKRARK